MTFDDTDRHSDRTARKGCTLAVAFLAIVAFTAHGSVAAAAGLSAGPAAPGPLPAIGGLFPGATWTTEPVTIVAGDPVSDQVPLAPGSEPIASPHNDLVGFEFGRTGPLDDATFGALTGPGGILFEAGTTNSVYTPRDALLLDEFRAGMQVTFVQAAGAFQTPTTPGSSFVVAVEYADPRYPSPPDGTFAGIPKAHRLEVRPEGHALVYAQFDGTAFGVFQSTTVVVDTCALQQPSAADPCGFLFLTALTGAETEGNVAVGVELYEQQGEFSVGDRIGEWPGQLIPADTVQPGALGITATTPPEASTSTVAAEPQATPAASPPVESASPQPQSSAPTESAPTLEDAGPQIQESGQPAPVVGQSESAGGDGDDGVPLLPIGVLLAGLAVTALGVGVVRRAQPEQPQAVQAAKESVLQFMETADASGAVAAGASTMTTTQRSELDVTWAQFLERNAEAETRVGEAASNVTKTLLPAFADFATIAGEFTAPYRRAVTGMVQLREHESEMETKLALAKIADLVVAVANLALLAKNVGKLAVHGVQWMRRPPAQQVMTVIDPPLNAGIGTFTGPQPAQLAAKPSWFRPDSRFASNWSEPRLGIDGEDALFWQMERMADEVGENLLGVITREGGIESAVEFLRLAVVRKRGFVVLDTADVLRLERIVIQARNAQRGEPHSYRLDDLQWLFARNTAEGRESLRAAVSDLEIKGSFEATDIPKVLSDNDVRLVDGLLNRPGLGDAIADATGSPVVDVGTGAFGGVLDLPGGGAAAYPGTARFGDVFDVPSVDPAATGAFRAVLDIPAGDVVRVGGDGFGIAIIPPTVGPGRLLDPVLDAIPDTGAGIPGTLEPGRFFPWTAGHVDPARTGAFGDVLFDGAKTQPFDVHLFTDPTSTVPPGAMSFGQASEFASSLLAAERTGVVSGPGAAEIVAGLPGSTPVAVFGPGVGHSGTVTTAASFVAGDALQPGVQAVTIFGQGYDTITGPPLSSMIDVGILGAGATSLTQPLWIAEFRPAEIAFVPTGDVPPGSHVVLTDAGMAFVDPTQPMRATPDAAVPAGLAAGAGSVTDPLRSFPLSSLTPEGSWLDPAWIADQQRALGELAQGLTDVKDIRSVLDNLVDPSWMEHDFCLLGVNLEGGAAPARLAWITLSAGMSPFEFVTRTTYFFIGGPMIESYVQTYASDYVLMKDLVHDAVDTLVAIESALPATIGVLQDARDAVAELVAEIEAFGQLHPDWVAGHRGDFDAKLARDALTIAHADQSLASLRHLQSLVAQLVPWVRSLIVAPDGSAVPAYMLAWPTSLLRISSTLLMLSDALGRICLLAPAPSGSDAATDDSNEEQLDKRVPGSYLEGGSDDPPDPEDGQVDDFSEAINRDDPIPRDE